MDIQKACDSFRVLLEEQMERIKNMNSEKTDFSKKENIVIGIVDGDGMIVFPLSNKSNISLRV